MDNAPRLILASQSMARQAMLRSAGLVFDAVPANIDEEAIQASMTSDSACVDASDIAATLAIEKAFAVAARYPGAFVIGADQVLALGTRIFSKAQTLTEAREILDTLRGRTHELVSAVALVRDGHALWHTVDAAEMTMRRFSDEFLSWYLAKAGNRVLSSAGCYEFEGLGAQLFESAAGDYYTILGLPLLPLLARLREEGLVLA